ncbi:MAG: DUF4435 domain-containing protein [Muribaculaceae bacterium]|nr:DUF4435 domain-containing protein [Muribaculaceae bacterium]
MAQDIKEVINSELIEALNAMQPEAAPGVVKVYVEGESDIPFWTACLLPWSRDGRWFDVGVYRRRDTAQGDTAEAEVRHVTGKQQLLNEFADDRLGPNMLLAIDADYDWIMEEYQYSPLHPEYTFSERIRSCPYILHTYLYGIENYQCHPLALESIWSKIAGRCMAAEHRGQLERWSVMMEPLFMLHLVSVEQRDFTYPLKKMKEWIHRFPVPFGKTEGEWKKLEAAIEEEYRKEEGYMGERETVRDAIKSRLAERGFGPKDYCLLVCGHSLRECGVMQKLPGLICAERSKSINAINTEGNETEREKLLRQFEKYTGVNRVNRVDDVSTRLTRLMDDFTDIHLIPGCHKRIQDDLRSIYGCG